MRSNPHTLEDVKPHKGILHILDILKPIFSREHADKQWLTGIIIIGILFLIPTYVSYFNGQLIFPSDGGAWAIASNLINGKGYSACATDYFPFCNSTNQATAMREPIPVLLMALAMLIYPSKVSGMILQSLFYLATIPVIYAILKKNSSSIPTALLAAFLWAVSIPVTSQVDNGSGDLAAAFFFSLGLFFFLKGFRESKTKDWIISGVLMGLAALSRTVFLGVSIGLGLAFLIKKLVERPRSSGKQLIPAMTFLVTVAIVFSPWVIRNTLVFGKPIIGSSLTGYNIFRMNFIITDDTFSPHYVGAKEAYPALMNLIKNSNLTGLENEAQMQSVYMKAGLQIIEQYPVRYLVLSLYRFMPLWFDLSVNEAYDSRYYLADYIAIVQQIFLLLGVLFGVSRGFGKNWPFILSLVLGCGAYMAIDSQMRYLVDLMPAVVILSALGVSNAVSFFNKPRPQIR